MKICYKCAPANVLKLYVGRQITAWLTQLPLKWAESKTKKLFISFKLSIAQNKM